MRHLWIVLAALSGAVLAAGFGGALHPAGDSLAVLRLPAAAGLAAGALMLSLTWRRRLALLLPAAAALVPLMGPTQAAGPGPSAPGLRLYQQNLLFDRHEDAAWLAAVAEAAPDVLTLQEVSDRNLAALAGLAADYPHRSVCPFASVGAVAVLSRFPAEAELCAEADGLAGLRVRTPAGPVWVVSIHLRWPWPFGQAGQVDRLVPLLEGLDGPVVIGGDFNAVRWSDSLSRIAGASGTRIAGPSAPTFRLPVLGAPIGIDHVLASGAARHAVEVMPRHGSDHRGVLARIAPIGGPWPEAAPLSRP